MRGGSEARAADPRGVGHELVRLDEDARRPRERAPPQAGRRPGRAALHPHGARRRLPLRGGRRTGAVSFRTRLVLAAFYVLTAVVLALVIPLASTVERRAESDFRSAVLGDAAVLAARVADFVPQAQGRVRAIVNEGARDPTRRVVVVDASGNVVADSAGQAPAGTPFASDQRPELGVALREGRIDTRTRASETVGDELQLVTVPVVDEGRVVGAVRMSASTSAIQESVRESWLRLAILSAAVIGAGLVLAWLLAVPLSRQVRNLSDASRPAGSRRARRPRARGGAEGARGARALVQPDGGLGRRQHRGAARVRRRMRRTSSARRSPGCACGWRRSAARAASPRSRRAKAEAELDRLDAIVDDLLALARASSRDSTAVAVDLADLVRDAAGRWREAAEAAGKRDGARHPRCSDAGRSRRLGRPRGSRPPPRQPHRQRDPLRTGGLGGARRGRAPRRRRRPARRRHRAGDPAGGPRARLRPLLPRSDRAPGRSGNGPGARNRRGARRALGRRGPAP